MFTTEWQVGHLAAFPAYWSSMESDDRQVWQEKEIMGRDMINPGGVGCHLLLVLPRIMPSMMAQTLRFGILSTGNIARQFAVGVRQSRRCVLQAVGSRQLASAEAFAAREQVKRAHGSYDQVLADDEVDAVYIALPNSMHHEWTLKALAAGKHVLCEKPFALNIAQAREMVDAAAKSRRVLVEAFMYRSNPQTLAVVETLRSGAIGELRLIRTSFNYKTTRIADNIRFNAELGGGALMDIGCYCIDFAQLVAGCQPTRVSAAGRMHPSGVDELAAGVLEFPGGLVASFTCGMTAAADNTAYVCGSEGYIQIPVPWKPPVGGAAFTIAYGTPPKMDQMQGPVRPTGPQVVKVPTDRDLYAYEADDFAATALDGAPARMPAEATLSNMRLLDELRRQVWGR
jgi:predicted dehydrogenase